MRKKILTIIYCEHCPNFDNDYFHYNERCSLLDRKIEKDELKHFWIPEDCPLEEEE